MLQWADTFNRYGGNAALMLNGLPYAAVSGSLVTDPDVTATGKVLALPASVITIDNFRTVYPKGVAATMGCACRLWLDKLPGGLPLAGFGWVITDIANAEQLGLRIETTGVLSVYRGHIGTSGTGTLLGSTAAPVIAPNAWNHIEFKYTVNTATGAFALRVNGVAVLTLTGVNTQSTANANSAQINFMNTSAGAVNPATAYLKDFILWDTTGAYNKDFLGTVSVLDIDATSDTLLTWTPSTGANGWSILDNNPPLDDAAYISAATPLSNTFGMGDLPADVTSVRGLVLVNRSRKIDGGDGNTQMGVISGASTALGVDRPITTAYTYWFDIVETDPATALPFTPPAFNAASMKLARTL